MGELQTVTLILMVDGRVASVWADAAAAAQAAVVFNADAAQGIIDGKPDLDAPYSVQTWAVTMDAPYEVTS